MTAARPERFASARSASDLTSRVWSGWVSTCDNARSKAIIARRATPSSRCLVASNASNASDLDVYERLYDTLGDTPGRLPRRNRTAPTDGRGTTTQWPEREAGPSAVLSKRSARALGYSRVLTALATASRHRR